MPSAPLPDSEPSRLAELQQYRVLDTPPEAAVQEALKGHSQFETEFRLVLPNMVIRHIKASAIVLMDEQGKAVRMTGTNYDISKPKRAEGCCSGAGDATTCHRRPCGRRYHHDRHMGNDRDLQPGRRTNVRLYHC
jgi:PAS fold